MMPHAALPQVPVGRPPGNVPVATLRMLTVLAVWLAVPGGLVAQAAEEAADPVWLISTRSSPARGAVDAADAQFGYWRLGEDRQWVSADLAALSATDDPAVPTTIYVHGNRADPDKAIRQSWPVYRCLKEQSAGRRFRFVIWSWPAGRVSRRNLRDLRAKAARSDTQAFYLAWYVDQVRPDVPVNLVGYSLGARVITGALHMLGGGQAAGYSLPERQTARRRPARVVLVAAAVDNDWLLPGHLHGQALGQIEHLLVTENGRDRALRWYPALSRRGRPHALGSTGAGRLATLGSGRHQIEVVRLGRWVGKAHDWARYLSAPELRARLPSYAFLDGSDEDGAQSPVLAGVADGDDDQPAGGS